MQIHEAAFFNLLPNSLPSPAFRPKHSDEEWLNHLFCFLPCLRNEELAMRWMNRAGINALCVCVLLVSTTAAQAFTFTVTRKESQSGTVKFADLSGNYQLAANEQLTDVRIYCYDANGREASVAQGTFTGSTWKAGEGDFRMVTYLVQFKVKYGNTTQTYTTKTYRWGSP